MTLEHKTKREMADYLRKVLNTNVEFENLTKNDLERLYELFNKINMVFLAKLTRKAAKNKLLQRHPMLRRLDKIVDVLLYFVRASLTNR